MKRNNCIVCGKELGIKSFWKKTKRCRKCFHKTIKKEGNPNCKHGETFKQHFCILCGNKICYNNFVNGSKKCRSCASKEVFKNPKDNPFYVHGKGREPYSFNFNLELKKQIRERDNFICQKCNITEEEHLIVYGKSLSIHHIDYDKKNCKEDNLITLCNECNIRVNFNRNYWKEFFQEKLLKGVNNG